VSIFSFGSKDNTEEKIKDYIKDAKKVLARAKVQTAKIGAQTQQVATTEAEAGKKMSLWAWAAVVGGGALALALLVVALKGWKKQGGTK